GDSNSEFNHYNNFLINIPNVANAQGIQLSGTTTTDLTSNTDFNLFTNTKILLPLTATVMQPIVLQNCDSNVFVNTLIFGGGAGTSAVTFDYTQSSTAGWPASNSFYGLDAGSNATTKFNNNGTPASGATPNYIYGLVETNGVSAPALANLAVFSSHRMTMSLG